MTDSVSSLGLYKIPSEEILQNRRAFYDLWRRSDDKTVAWMKRIQNCIQCCDYPKIIMDFLLFDRFVCGLNANESKSIQSVIEYWSLDELLEYFSKKNNDTIYININSLIDKNVKQHQTIALAVVKTEPIEEECLPNNSINELVNECDSFVKTEPNVIEEEYPFDENSSSSNAEERGHQLASNEMEIDHEMLANGMKFECEDYKVSQEDSVRKNGSDDSDVSEENEDSNDSDYSKHLLEKYGKSKKRKRHSCDECDQPFSHSSSLIRHKKVVHQQIIQFTCSQCNKSFSSSYSLKNHSLKHTGERPYACDDCEKTFQIMASLERHIKTVHQEIRPFACQQCNKRFSNSTGFKTHLLSHTGARPFTCDICKKCFSSACDLKRHSVSHTGERPYTCNKCNKSFSQTASLDRHQKTVHQRIRSHVCKQCDKRFTTAFGLKQHLSSSTHTRMTNTKGN